MAKPVILCVDDEKFVLDSLKEQIKRYFGTKYSVETIESGEDALEVLEECLEENKDIPVIISDQIMPGIKGDKLLIEVHQRSPKTLKILLTGQAGVDAVGNALNEANLYRYISKPWEHADLMLTVKEAIRSFFQDKTLEEKNQELESLNQELEQKIDTFYKFVPNQFLNVLNLEEEDHIALGECSGCTMSVVFSDIRSFTTLSESLTSEENFRFINSYLSQMGPLIRKHEGFIDKFIGDAIMALFKDADDALQATLDMQQQLAEYNDGRKRAGYIPIRIGTGINTGPLILGTVGENDRMQTTVIGDSVNLASRTEGLTKVYDTPVLITEHTYHQLKNPDRYTIRLLDHVQVKGKNETVTIFEVLDPLPPALLEKKMAICAPFEEALFLYQSQKFEQAQSLFQQCLTHCKEDSATRIYLESCQVNLAN